VNIKIDIERIRGDKSLNDLNWEIAEARGVKAGDLVALWDVCLRTAESAAQTYQMSLELVSGVDLSDFSLELIYIAQSLDLLSHLLAREAREIAKFLDKRGFVFPVGYIGRYKGEGYDLSGLG
jgi:hypothetical protein